VDNNLTGYLDLEVSLQQDADQFESQWEKELVDIGFEPVEYTASFLATAENAGSLPREVLKESIWIGIRGVNPNHDPNETNIEDTSSGPIPLSGSIEKYLSQAVPTVKNFEPYSSVLNEARDQAIADEGESTYFVTSQAKESNLPETLRELEQNGVAGIRSELSNGEEVWQVYQEHNGRNAFYETPEITGKYDPDLEYINL
jgi:hypothetical protein